MKACRSERPLVLAQQHSVIAVRGLLIPASLIASVTDFPEPLVANC